MAKIAPSILSADFSKLGEQVKRTIDMGIEVLHIDVMDGSFVPNISFGVPIIKSIRPITKQIFDVHLMIENPANYVEDFVKAGADMITVHYEADRHIDRTIKYIKSFGVKAGVALNPATPIDNLHYLLDDLDMVLVMTVNPGFGGQKFIPYCSKKIIDLKNMINNHGKNIMIGVDGGVDKSNIKAVVQCGADLLVAGSAVFNGDNIEGNIKLLKEEL